MGAAAPGQVRFVRLRYAPPHFASPARGLISLIQLLNYYLHKELDTTNYLHSRNPTNEN